MKPGHVNVRETSSSPERLVKVVGRVVLATAAFMAAALFLAGAAGPVYAHQFEVSDCKTCHKKTPVDAVDARQNLKGPASRLCTGCHGDIDPISHHVGMKPTFAVPASLPLDSGGGVTCITCHDPHDKAGVRAMLRDPGDGPWRCGLCHKGELSTAGKQTHRPVMDLAHGFARITLYDKETELDPLTLDCMGCHDRPDLPDLARPGMPEWRHGNNTFIPHATGMVYEDKAYENRNLMMDANEDVVVLFEGKVGCASCHDPYQPGGGLQLREGSRRQYEKLCFNCHDMQCPGSGGCRLGMLE